MATSRAGLQDYCNIYMYFTEHEWQLLDPTSGFTLLARKEIAEDRAWMCGLRNASEYTLKVGGRQLYTCADLGQAYPVPRISFRFIVGAQGGGEHRFLHQRGQSPEHLD